MAEDTPQTPAPDLTPFGLELVIEPRAKDLGGFIVRRTLPFMRRRLVGPWIFFDHMGPAAFEPGIGVNVRPHPHIGLATVTYLFDGAIQHRDSLGSFSVIRPGDINLMIAGSGIVHSEREVPETLETPRKLHGLQLWHALPEADEEMPAEFHHHDAAEIPEVLVYGVPVRVMMGEAYGLTSPVKTLAKTLYLEVALKAGDTYALPDFVEEAAFYTVNGSVVLGKRHSPERLKVGEAHMGIYRTGDDVVLTAHEDTRLVIIGGEKLSQRYIYWNFVSSSEARIEQARQDWRAKKFPVVPGDEIEFIPLPE